MLDLVLSGAQLQQAVQLSETFQRRETVPINLQLTQVGQTSKPIKIIDLVVGDVEVLEISEMTPSSESA